MAADGRGEGEERGGGRAGQQARALASVSYPRDAVEVGCEVRRTTAAARREKCV